MQWIAQARAAGLSDTQIAEQLAQQGWQANQIHEILTPQKPTPTPTENVRAEIQSAFDPSAQVKGKPWPMRHLILLASLLGGLIVLGGVAFAAVRGYIPVPFLQPNGEKLLSETLLSLETVKSGEIGVTITVEAQTPTEENQDAGSDLFSSLGIDSFISAGTRMNARVTTFFSTDTQDVTKLRGTFKLQGAYVSGGTSYAADIEARMIDQKVYVLANTLPSFPMFDTSSITKKWFVIEQDVTQPYFDTATKGGSAQHNFQIARTEIAKLLQLGMQSHAIILGKVTRENLDGTTAQKVPITFDLATFSDLAKTYKADAEKRNVKSDVVDAIVDMLSVDPTIQEATPALTVTIWSNPANHMFRKAEFDVVAAEDATNPASAQVHVTMGMTLAHVNEQPVVVAPTDATPFVDAVSQLLGGPRAAARNAQRMSDVSQLRTGLALYFDNENVYPESLQAIVDAKHISSLPTPPNPDEQYTYSPSENKKTFQLCATLEKESKDGQTTLYCLKNDGTTSETSSTSGA